MISLKVNMSESIITISSKTSPLPTQVVPSRFRNIEQQTISNEKNQLQKLNERFLSYIERVRIFETYNHCLTVHCEQIEQAQQRTKTNINSLKHEFDEYQTEKYQRDTTNLQTITEQNKQKEKQIEIYKTKQTLFESAHESNRKKIIELQKKFIDLQTKTEHLRSEYENLNDDNVHYRKQLTSYQSLKSSILDELAHQRDIHQRLQIEVEDLKAQKQLTIQTYEADSQAIEIRNDNMFYDLTNNFRLDPNVKHPLTQMLNEIRQEYKIKDQNMRDELQRKYLYEYNQHIKKDLEQNLIANNREDIERRHLSNELNSLNNDRILLEQKLCLIKEHYKQLENNYQQEFQRQHEMKTKYEQQIQQLRISVDEYENLLKNNSTNQSITLEFEVDKYRQLLEGTDKQIGLRQLVHMPNKSLEQYSPIHRPKTPPPPPPTVSIEKSESIFTPLILPSLTRENSASETSYDTALISPSSTASTTTTNQQYLTLESTNEKNCLSDYDTDNDQSQTIQYMSGRSSRLTSQSDTTPLAMTPNDQETLPPLPAKNSINLDETIVEIPINSSQIENPINQTLPFVPMNLLSSIEDNDENKETIFHEQQAPIISTLEQRKEDEQVEKQMIEPPVLSSIETIIPISIDIDSKSTEESIELKIVSPATPIISTNEQETSSVSPSDQPQTENNTVEVPISALPETSPLAKLISTMLPNATPFVPTPVSAPISAMNNDAQPFIPGQHQQYTNNMNTGHWNTSNQRGGAVNRRGQMSGGGFHHGGGNQRSGGGNNWQQGGQHKQRRGGK